MRLELEYLCRTRRKIYTVVIRFDARWRFKRHDRIDTLRFPSETRANLWSCNTRVIRGYLHFVSQPYGEFSYLSVKSPGALNIEFERIRITLKKKKKQTKIINTISLFLKNIQSLV